MKYEDAQRSVLLYLAQDYSRDLEDAQVEQLTQHLADTVKDIGDTILPQAVAQHADRLFPKNQRVVPPREPQQKQKQTREEITAELAAYFNQGWWSQMAPGTIPAVTPDAKIGSQTNHAAFFGAVNARISRSETINRDFLNVIVLNLFERGLLEKLPASPVVIEPPPPPSERDLHNAQIARARAMNQRDTSPIKGAKEKAQPLVKPVAAVLTEEQRVALNEKNRADDAVIAEAQHRISMFQGRTHSRTYSGRAELAEVFQSAMDEGVEAKEVLRRVDAKIEQLTPNNSIR